jgi:hypothetical protein
MVTAPGVLPTGTIYPVYRLDGSGTTFLLTQHLHLDQMFA